MGSAGSASAVAASSSTSVNNTISSFNTNGKTYYSTSGTAPATALFLGGNGDTRTAGATQITTCQTSAPNPDAFLQQNCDAVNFMVKNPKVRPQFTISPTSPLIVQSKIILANAPNLAATAMGYASASAVGGFSGCTSTTVAPPAVNSTEVCNDFTVPASQTCAVGRSVAVNANTNYQCNQTNNAFSTQTCTRQANAVVTPTYFCSISGSATGLGSYEKTTTKRVYSSALRKWVYTTTTSIIPYPYFDVVFGCDAGKLAMVTVTINAAAQCHWDACNSDYYPMKLDFVPGKDAGPVSVNMARTYDGNWWESPTMSYKGATNTVTITLGRLTVSAVPSGTAGLQNVITSSWVDGCATQEAAAK